MSERELVLKNLIRSYLVFFASENIETWIAHGTLLGWFWNGQILPWDYDIDVQVSGETLLFLGEHWNMTHHFYEIPHSDAQLLGTERTGETSETDDSSSRVREYLLDVNRHVFERVRGDGQNVIDARWIDTHNGLYIDITGLSETSPDNEPGVVRCKNNHKYFRTDLYPMRDSTFEDVPAKIPYAYDKILIGEYQEKALTVTEFEG
jgi:LicD family